MPRNRLGLMPLAAVMLALAWPAAADPQAPAKKITYEQAYSREPREGGFARMSGMVSWLDDENCLVREWDDKAKAMRFFRIAAGTGVKTPHLDLESMQKGLPQGFAAGTHVAASADMSRLIFNSRNDLYLYMPKTQAFRRLTANPAPEKTPRLSPDARYAAYTRDNNLWACDLDTGLEFQITADGSETILNGCESWVYMEEVSNRQSQSAAFWWSPDSRKLVFQRFDDSPVPVFNIVRSTGVHGELERQRYPKAGDPNPRVKVGIASLPDNTVVWADFDERADEYLAWPKWFADSSRVVVQWMNRGQDEIKLFAVDPATGKKMEIYSEKQPAWVEFFPDLHFLKDGSGFLLRTDADGWSHLYLYDLAGHLRARLTRGEWAVAGISLVDEKNRRVYFTAAKEDTTGRQLFRVGFDGRGLEQLTREPGTHITQVSHGGSYFTDSFSTASSRGRQAIYRTDGVLVRGIPAPDASPWEGYRLAKKELFRIPTEDGYALPAYWILPPDLDRSKKYPVLFQVYGGPAAPTVSDTYPSISQLYLVQEGIIVMSVDHRGSGHFGKKGTALMHRNLGKWEMNDLIQAVKWLREQPFVDASKIGITGSSYGGYATCLALTRGAGFFTHGLAGSSVTDWQLYDSIYTERYMDAPAENKEGYESGSVVTHAKNLKGVLFIEHGDMDDNVHMQNSVQLINALMDEGKDFDFALFPNQRHGYGGKKREAANRRAVDFWFRHLLGRSNG
jgi:dipeptidyl-peptidase 4